MKNYKKDIRDVNKRRIVMKNKIKILTLLVLGSLFVACGGEKEAEKKLVETKKMEKPVDKVATDTKAQETPKIEKVTEEDRKSVV